ncbi:MAG: DNA repair protein RecO [Bacteroidetes bacterium]|nr:DNA repair protein RecO [Bacteroidota bacterium]
MIAPTQSIVLRAVKYGETSIISTQFTRQFGVQAYLIRGARAGGKGRGNKAGMLQPGTLLDIVCQQKPHTQLQQLKELTPTSVYRNIYEEPRSNSVALFATEVLLRLLPEAAPIPELFDFAQDFLLQLDRVAPKLIANFPLYFLLHCARALGYELVGQWTEETPYLNLMQGSFTAHPPQESTQLTTVDTQALSLLMSCNSLDEVTQLSIKAMSRSRLLEWFIEFLKSHTEHMGNLKSLAILKVILH